MWSSQRRQSSFQNTFSQPNWRTSLRFRCPAVRDLSGRRESRQLLLHPHPHPHLRPRPCWIFISDETCFGLEPGALAFARAPRSSVGLLPPLGRTPGRDLLPTLGRTPGKEAADRIRRDLLGDM
ncbi:hypothetical protein L210DRAFT_3556257 [Boletus edulis BED1]|uniref:Uncharacterized protein n=1 Tax=Boletus edulis BED1 TaxID=1328754 RepID=A0AAD4BKU0_BOLED|nr:hypothetical protein L210DRAFT_3556257 [Boletus edulis BED1]